MSVTSILEKIFEVRVRKALIFVCQ